MSFFNWLFSTQPESKIVIKDNNQSNLSNEEKELLFEKKVISIIEQIEKDIPILFDKTHIKNFNINKHINKSIFDKYWLTYLNQYDIARLEIPFTYHIPPLFAIRLARTDKYLYNEFEDLGYVKFNMKIHNKLEIFFTRLCKYHEELEKERMLLKEQEEVQERQSIIDDLIN